MHSMNIKKKEPKSTLRRWWQVATVGNIIFKLFHQLTSKSIQKSNEYACCHFGQKHCKLHEMHAKHKNWKFLVIRSNWNLVKPNENPKFTLISNMRFNYYHTHTHTMFSYNIISIHVMALFQISNIVNSWRVHLTYRF